MTTGRPGCYTFGPYVLDPGRGILLRKGERVALTPRTLTLLEVLVARAGEVLGKDEVLRQVWGGAIVEENNLARQISSLRKALGETPGRHDYIVTVPGIGYRFVAPVARLEAPEPPVVAPRFWVRPRIDLAAAVILAAAAGAALVWTLVPAGSLTLAAPVQRSIRQFTFWGGLQQDPVWSPDGARIAFASDREGHLDIWVQGTGDAHPARVTSWPSREWQPDWSPDGRSLVFRADRDGGGLFVVSADGGEPRRVSDFGDHPQWSPTGEWILFSNANVRTGARKLYVVSPDGGTPQEIRADVIEPLIASTWLMSVETAWHPDGRRISIWGQRGDRWAFVTAPIFGGPVTDSAIPGAAVAELAEANLTLGRFIWARTGAFLYFEGQSGDTRNVWRVRVHPDTLDWTGAPERLTTDVGEERDIALSPDGTHLALTVRSHRTRVWAFDFDPRLGRLTGSSAPLTPSSLGQLDVDTLRDGSRLAYRAVRSGRSEVREFSTGDGHDRVLLASNEWRPTSPRWSSDGRRLAYSRPVDSGSGSSKRVVAVLSTDERQEQLLPLPGDVVLRPSDWSADGLTILGDCRERPGAPVSICSMPAGGSADDARDVHVLFADPARHLFGPRLSPDQRWIAFVAVEVKGTSTTSQLYVAPVAGGPWVPVTSGRSFIDKPRWAPDGHALYFVSDRSEYLNLFGRRFDPAAGRFEDTAFPVTAFNSSRRGLPSNIAQIEFAIAEQRLFLPLTETESDVWLLDDVDK
jgi:Tol biopolymer transport system component/DNA-binding winged helix-turn-helix (wHTH) protein